MPRISPAWAVFVVRFAAYQIPEGIGIHMLHSPAVQAALLLLFVPVAWLLARARGYRGFGAYAMGRHPRWLRKLGLMVVVAFLVKALAVAFGLRLGVYRVESAGALSPATLLVVLGIVFTTF